MIALSISRVERLKKGQRIKGIQACRRVLDEMESQRGHEDSVGDVDKLFSVADGNNLMTFI